MKIIHSVSVFLVLMLTFFSCNTGTFRAGKHARSILEAAGINGGLVVVLGCDDPARIAGFRASESYIVHALVPDPGSVEEVNEYIWSKELGGKVSVDVLDGKHLAFADNMVNLIVVESDTDIEEEELMRALCPRGVLITMEDGALKKSVKPLPGDTDEWTHTLYDASGNAVSKDRKAGPPKHLQWTAGPKWTRHHESMSSFQGLVSSAGRIFYIIDEGPNVSLFLPSDWKLVARDAYNGKILWKKNIEDWVSQLYKYKSGPTQMTRRLVASGNRIYVTPGLTETVHILDAETGETLRVLEDKSACEEILIHKDILYLMTNDDPNLYRGEHRFSPGNAWSGQKKWLKAADPESGKILWAKETPVAPMSFAVNENGVFFHDGKFISCLDLESGKEIWKSEHILLDNVIATSVTPTLVAYKDVIMFWGGDDQPGYRGGSGHYVEKNLRTFYTLSSHTGELLWSYRVPEKTNGFESPKDILVLDDLVWLGEIFGGKSSGKWIGRDLHSGEIEREFAPPWDIYWFHQRCYRTRATEKYIMPSRTGIEFISPEDGYVSYNHWVRGACLTGTMPANGLVYAPVSPCGCYMEALLHGFNALAPASESQEIPGIISEKGRLQKGPGFERSAKGSGNSDEEWPTFRGDGERSGHTRMEVSPNLKTAWKTKIGEDLTAITIGYEKVFVAEKDKHLLHALNAATGREAWQFMAGGRIDSPPTIANGKVVFGSADGYVYCLNVDDGELAWKYRAAPIERKLVANEQLESVWPVHGSTLIIDETVYCIAGRSMFLDGGMRFLALDLHTGQKITERVLDETDPSAQGILQDKIDRLNMPVATSDILSCDEKYIYMKSQKFNMDGSRPAIKSNWDYKDQLGDDAHLFSAAGLLDNSGFHRVSMQYGKVFSSGWDRVHINLKYAPGGKMIVFDDDRVYGFSRLPHLHRWTRELEFHIFAADKKERFEEMISKEEQEEADNYLNSEYANDIILHAILKDENEKKRLLRSLTSSAVKYNWSIHDPSLYVNTMVLAGNTLFAAGPPAIRNEDSPEALARWQGEKGGLLLGISPETGAKAIEYVLEAPTVFQGMAVAYDRLYLSLMDGTIVCMEEAKH